MDKPLEVCRLRQLDQYTGLQRTQNALLVELGLFHPFDAYPGGRARVVTMQEVAALQKVMMELAEEGYKIDNPMEMQQMLRERANAGKKFENPAEFKKAIIELVAKQRKRAKKQGVK